MNLLDIDTPDTVPLDQPPNAYLDLAHQSFLRSVEWQRRGAAWQELGMDAMDRIEQEQQLTYNKDNKQ